MFNYLKIYCFNTK